MKSRSKRYILIFNGEIYNHNLIRLQLKKHIKSLYFNGSSDTETLRFILELTIQDFVNKRTTSRSYSLKEFDPLENDDDPFDEENPF